MIILSSLSLVIQMMILLYFLLGVIRLVHHLSQSHLFGKEKAMKFVVDAGTGTTAVGLGLGAICYGCVSSNLFVYSCYQANYFDDCINFELINLNHAISILPS